MAAAWSGGPYEMHFSLRATRSARTMTNQSLIVKTIRHKCLLWIVFDIFFMNVFLLYDFPPNNIHISTYIHVYYYAFFSVIVVSFVFQSCSCLTSNIKLAIDSQFVSWKLNLQTGNSLLIFTSSVLVTSLIGTERIIDLCSMRQTKTRIWPMDYGTLQAIVVSYTYTKHTNTLL